MNAKYKKAKRLEIFQSERQFGIPFDEYEEREIPKLINSLFTSLHGSFTDLSKIYYYVLTGFDNLSKFDNSYKLRIYKIEDDYYGVIYGEGNGIKYFIADQFDGLIELIKDIHSEEELWNLL